MNAKQAIKKAIEECEKTVSESERQLCILQGFIAGCKKQKEILNGILKEIEGAGN